MSARTRFLLMFLLPSLIFLGIFTYYPIFISVKYSLTRYNMLSPKPVFIGLQNYIKLFKNPVFWQVLKNNIIYGLGVIPTTMLLALFFAILINETKKFKALFELGLFYPLLIPMTAAAMIWVFMYDPDLGIVDKFLGLFGIPNIGWLGDARYSLLALIIMAIWKNVGYFMLIYLAGLQNIPDYLYEEATIEGAGWLKKHLYVTWPLIGPTNIFVFIISIIQSFKVFTQVYLMTEGGPGYSSNVLIYYTYEYAFKFWNIGMASALTTIMILFLLLLVLIIFGVFEKRITYSIG